ncbi:M23 family metallopeptidase [Nocardioides sp. URHA0020]|uniref:M23 family metallopeptidase n=1 Tax=Nocardioides sp. URHA0020 TaxID=1380392 RepID=UPI000491675D|nr:M23 family metallopeptidase [Nocardioides sp. URHA0020]
MSCLALGALAVPIAMAEDGKALKDRQHQAKRQIQHAKQDLDESSSQVRRTAAALDRARAELAAAQADLRAANAKLHAAQLRDDAMQKRLDTAEKRLATAQQDLVDGQAALEAQRLSLTDTITDIYEQGDPGLVAFSSLLKSRSTTDLTRQEAYNAAVVGREAYAYDDLHAAEVLLKVREGQVQDARDAVEVERRSAAEHLVTMQRLRKASGTALAKVRTLVVSSARAKSAAWAARKHDLHDLQVAKQREQKVRKQILAEARRARGGYRGSTNGLLMRPVPGPVTSSYGFRIHPIYGYWGLHDGTDFGVSCGEGMKAVAGGRVIAKYWSDVYGNRLYVSLGNINGKNVTAVYNHATGYRVGVGERVRQGEVVGYVGSTGWSTGCHLHFTILVNGNAVDPMKWL